MKPLRAVDVRRAVGAAGRALSAALEIRRKPITPDMLNSAGSVSAEWYLETLWFYLAKQSLLKGVSSFDVEFKQPARLADKQLHFALPHTTVTDLVMDFHIMRPVAGGKTPQKVSVAHVTLHRGQWRRRHGVAPEPPRHPYGIEIRTRHLNSARHVSWHTLVALTMDVARRGAQLADEWPDREGLVDRTRLYVVPRFTFTPLADAAHCDNLFIYPEFAFQQPWIKGKTSCTARITIWAVANEAPWPVVETIVTVVRTSIVDGLRQPVDEAGQVRGGR